MVKRIIFSGRKKQLIPLIFLVFILTLFFSVVIIVGVPDAASNKATNRMSMSVNYQFLNEWYNEPVVIINNQDNRSWEDCQINVNSGYIAKVDGFSSIGTQGDNRVVSMASFVRSDGTVFDYLGAVPRTACISCNKPEYGIFCGQF